MKTTRLISWLLMFLVLGSSFAMAQQNQNKAPPQPMSFFITSTGSGNGANLGGLAGADALCQRLAAASGATGASSKTWHAYLSTQAKSGGQAVNARDRIGTGPWYGPKGAKIADNVADLHGDGLADAFVHAPLGNLRTVRIA